MVEYEETVEYEDGIGHAVVRPKTTIVYRNGIGERVPELDEEIRYGPRGAERVPISPQPIRMGKGINVNRAIESALNSSHPEERALLPQLAEMKQKQRGKK
jgi:hypothetical protein